MDIYIYYQAVPPKYGPIILGAGIQKERTGTVFGFAQKKFTVEKRTKSLFVTVAVDSVSHYGGNHYDIVSILGVADTMAKAYSVKDLASHSFYWAELVQIAGV